VIHSEMYKLNDPRYLNLSNAGFEGQIQHEICHLIRLVTLDFLIYLTPHVKTWEAKSRNFF